eukprot:GHUV01005010.1.p1 GENE.GHUV01005010.1~~GHUV01005010.1.p1  ORF type:complete len:339 (+),score=75.36 GHUV01005010.1:493-1509(+)
MHAGPSLSSTLGRHMQTTEPLRPELPAAAPEGIRMQQESKRLPQHIGRDAKQLRDQDIDGYAASYSDRDVADGSYDQFPHMLPVSTAAAAAADLYADAPYSRPSIPDQQTQPAYAIAKAPEEASASPSHVAITVNDEPSQQAECSTPQLQRSPTGLSTTSQHARECRICLAADNPEDLVQPCSCTGSVQYAHMDCLKSWVQERANLQCELCGKQYRDEIKQQLEPLLAGRRPRRSRSRTVRVVNANGETVLSVETVEGPAEEPRSQISWTRFWIHLGILVMLLVAVLYLALFVNVGASDNFWLMFLWRAITVILPLFLIIRCVAALYAWRQQYVASRM